ncbi:MAG: hypothetical protein JWQ09_6082 [Segetibacter sp.]|nr:hypothetical protein [Segetibacter sp.]
MQTLVNHATTVAGMFDAFKKGDLEKLISYMHPMVIWKVSGHDPIPYGGSYRGHNDTKKFFLKLDSVISFKEFEPDKILNADDDTVVSMGHFVGTVKATGKEVKSDFVMITEFDEQDMVVSYKDFMDTQAIANAFM